MAIIKTHSHRARAKLKSLLGTDPQGYFSFHKNGDWREIPDEQLENALKIKGITKSKLPEGALKYINWS
jgi:hypothetical protein